MLYLATIAHLSGLNKDTPHYPNRKAYSLYVEADDYTDATKVVEGYMDALNQDTKPSETWCQEGDLWRIRTNTLYEKQNT